MAPSTIAAGIPTAVSELSARQIQQQAVRMLAQLARPGSSPEQLQASYELSCKQPVMHTFADTDPAFCPMIKTKRGSFRPNNGVADSGCVPDLIFSGQAKDAGLYIHLFAEDEKPKVLNIEGAGMTRIIGRTEPASIVFGQGTAAEMEVPLHDGFLVVDNPAVERMYSCVFGRSCLDQVSGFVVPYLQAFFYMPRMKQLDTTLAHMPVKIGSSEQRKSMASQNICCCGG
ncbi:hypothetical protein COO60DRAFT_1685349 [Scenedesmus sp. NREL 46B-D3]|nr:hypothetical protein COO60DRAFT_1685349 [Scenedesmus sp. NREL 46B-D3]